MRSRNFRLFFLGQSASLVGTSMQQVAAGWLLYTMTRSPALLGAAGFASQIPAFFLAPVAGVLADRWDRRRLFLATQLVCLLQALLLGFLVLSGNVRVWQILVLGAVLGAATAFEVTLRHSFAADLVEHRDDLGNAIALNSSAVNGARLVGPSAAGLLIALAGEGACFLFNAVSYLPAIAALVRVRTTVQASHLRSAHPVAALKEGFHYAFQLPPIRALVLLLSWMAFFGMPHTVLMPVFAKEVLHGGPRTMGFLAGACGLGAVAGSLYLAWRRGVVGLGRVMVAGTLIFGGGLVLFAASRTLWLSLASLVLVGFGLMVHLAAGNTLAQSILDDDKRGRVMSIFVMAFVGVMPLGSLAAGSAADVVGAPAVLAGGGVACMLGAGWFATRRQAIGRVVRPLYEKAGIIPTDPSLPPPA